MAGQNLTQEQLDDPYIQGVLETAGDVDFAVLDPNSFAGIDVDIPNGQLATTDQVTAEHIEQFRAVMDSLKPNISDAYTDDVITNAVVTSLNDGPRAFWFEHEGERFGLINDFHESIDDTSQILKLIAHDDGILPAPGEDAEWKHLFGRHEGATLDNANLSSNMTEDEIILNTLNDEIGDDRVALADNDGDISQAVKDAMIDYRNLVPGDEFDDFDHANGIFLNPGNTELATQAHLDAARSVVPMMISGVAADLGVSEPEVRVMRIENPEKFIDAVDSLAEQRAFTQDINGVDNPHVQEYIQNYTSAYREHVLNNERAALDEGGVFYDHAALQPLGDGTPVITQGGLGESDTLTIGADSANGYFAKLADPALAEQRIAMMAEANAQLETDPTDPNLQNTALRV